MSNHSRGNTPVYIFRNINHDYHRAKDKLLPSYDNVPGHYTRAKTRRYATTKSANDITVEELSKHSKEDI